MNLFCVPCQRKFRIDKNGAMAEELVKYDDTAPEQVYGLWSTDRWKCPKCGTRFWAEPELIQTSLFDGSLRGFHCPKCGTAVGWERKP